MGDLYYMLPDVALSMPSLATLVAGVVLLCVRRKRLAPRSWKMGVAGLAALLTVALADLLYAALLPLVLGRNSLQDTMTMAWVAGLGFLVTHVLGMSLLIAAVLTTGPARVEPSWAVAGPPSAIEPPAVVEPRGGLG